MTPDETPEMVARLKTKLALHRQALNSQQSSLLTKLPTELILNIGERVLGITSLKSDKARFRRVLPLLQTCVQLRAQLRPLLHTLLVCEVKFMSTHLIEAEVLKAWAKWKKNGSYQGRTILIVNNMNGYGLKLGTAAIIAGALERAIYGSLSREPAVYIRCTTVFIWGSGGGKYYISHRRESMIGESHNYFNGRSFRYINREELDAVWVKARENRSDREP
jgi:hypothetical protein